MRFWLLAAAAAGKHRSRRSCRAHHLPAPCRCDGSAGAHVSWMETTASPQKVRGKRGAGPLPRLAATTASVLFLFAVMYAFGILPFVGLARDYSAQDYDNPLSEDGRAGAGRAAPLL